jgi:nucleoid-associated protein YgaU
MSKIAAFLSANAGPVIGAGVLTVGAVGTGVYMGVLSPKDAPLAAATEVAMPAEDLPEKMLAVVEPKPEVAPVVKPEPEVVAIVPRAPSLDEVRSEADGLTVLAGRGEPGSVVTLFVDNVKNMTADVGADGAFAIIAFLDPSPNARVLSVVQSVGDIEMAAADIILAPQAVAVATIQPEPEIETVVEAVAVAEPVEVVAQQTQVQEAVVVKPAEEAVEEKIEEVAAVTPKIAPKPEPTEVAILKSDEGGVEVINRSSAPDVMANVEIDTISYSQVGDVLLSGRAQSSDNFVRVYLDNAVVTNLEVDTSGRWRGDLPDVDTGIYTLRVDEVDSQGAVTSRVETPFKREAPEVLEAANGTQDAPVKAITVQAGATLWAIARDRYGDGTLFVRVVEANAGTIKDANLIYPGQVFELPE